MTKTFIKVFLIALVAHMVLTMTLIIYGFDLGSIDTGVPSPILKQIAFRMAGFLMMPIRVMWSGWMSKTLPNWLEWLALSLNSALWAAVIALCTRGILKQNGTVSK